MRNSAAFAPTPVREPAVAVEPRQLSVVLIECDEVEAELVVRKLSSMGIRIDLVCAPDKAQIRAALTNVDQVDAVLCAYELEGVSAFDALRILRASGSLAPLIVVNGGVDDEVARECIRRGAADYIVKGDLGRLHHAVTQAIRHASAGRESRDVLRKYLSLFENLPMAVVEATDDGRILHANPAAVEIFGFADTESMLAVSAFDLYVEPEERRGMLARLETEGHLAEFECLMRRADGSEFWFSRVVHSVSVEDGTFVVWETIGRDMSERRRAALELAKSQENLRALLDGAPVAMVTLDHEGRFTYAGGSALSQIGVAPSTLVGRLVSDRLADRPDVLSIFAQAVREEVHADLEFEGHTFHVRAAPYRLTPGGDAIGVLAVGFDNSDRVAADLALRQSEEVFRTLFEQSTVGILLADVQPDGHMGVLRWNDRIRDMLGVRDTSDEPWRLMYNDVEQVEIEAKFARLLSGEATELRERRMWTRPDGQTLWVDWSAVLLRGRDGGPPRFQTIALDVTEQVEGELRRSRHADQQEILLELSRAGLEGYETPEFLSIAVELAARGTGTQHGVVLESHPPRKSLMPVAHYGSIKAMRPGPNPVDASFLSAGPDLPEMPVTAFRYESQPQFRRSKWMIECNVVASLAVGIRGALHPYGVLLVHSDIEREFSPEDLQFMQLAATIISVAVDRKLEEKQRRLLVGRLVNAQEGERKTIAADIHDDAVQIMTAANMRLELFRRALTDPVQADAAQKLQETVALAIGRLRNLLFELIPPDLDRHGLAEAMRRHLERFESETGVACHLAADVEEEPRGQVRIILFRIFQEAMVNVGKHARATTIRCSLEEVDGGLLLRLEDNGVGFQDSESGPVVGHLGLASMRERAEIAGGWWRLTSKPGDGTAVSAWIPAPPSEAPPASAPAPSREPLQTEAQPP